MTNESLLSAAALAFWTRCLRLGQKMSQEALAAAANLDTRTIQRIEAGHPSSVSTRRRLADGLGYENKDVFECPQFAVWLNSFINDTQRLKQNELCKQHPDHIAVPVSRAAFGDILAGLTAANATFFRHDDDLSLAAKRQAACIFDYLRDIGDGYDELSFTDQLVCSEELDQMLRDLERLGAWAYSALRHTRIVGEKWLDQSPMPISIGYLAVLPEDKAIGQLMVPKRLS